MIRVKTPDEYIALDKNTINQDFNLIGEQKANDSAEHSDFYRTDVGTLQQLTNDVTVLNYTYTYDNAGYRSITIPAKSIYSNIIINLTIPDLLTLTQANTVIPNELKDDALYFLLNFEEPDYATKKNINIQIFVNKGLDDNNYKGYSIKTNLNNNTCNQLLPTTNEGEANYQNPNTTVNKCIINFNYTPLTDWSITAQIPEVKEMFGDYSYQVMNRLNAISMLDFNVRHWYCIQKTSNRTFSGVNYGPTASDGLLTAFYPDRQNEIETFNFNYSNLPGDATQSPNRNPTPAYSNLSWVKKTYARQSQTGDNLLSSLSTPDLIKQIEVIHSTYDTLDYFMKNGAYQPRTEYGTSICGFLNNIPNIPLSTPKIFYIINSFTFKSRYPKYTLPIKWFDYSKTTMNSFTTSSVPFFQSAIQNQGTSDPTKPVYTNFDIMYGFTLTKDTSGTVGTAAPFNRGYLRITSQKEYMSYISRSSDELIKLNKQIEEQELQTHKITIDELMNEMDKNLIQIKKQAKTSKNKNFGIIEDKGDIIADCPIVIDGQPTQILVGLNVPEQTIPFGKIVNSSINRLLNEDYHLFD